MGKGGYTIVNGVFDSGKGGNDSLYVSLHLQQDSSAYSRVGNVLLLVLTTFIS
jgi:hypothetical protein